ncbi:MAG: S-methyl-5-thioribose-1-phosphate isomerase [Bradymonadia bacterium]
MGSVHAAFETIRWQEADGQGPDRVVLIDQRRLPTEEIYIEARTWVEAAATIKEMAIRGAPAIGIAAAYGVVLAALEIGPTTSIESLPADMAPAFEGLAATRPTAVNLFWALERMRGVMHRACAEHDDPAFVCAQLLTEAHAIKSEDIAMCQAMGDRGAALLPEGARVLTHCNAGGLATGGYGTALGVIRSAWRSGRLSSVYADETRPFLQGARLTAWELHKEQIPVKVITDNMAGHLMQRGLIDAVVVGTDRVAANGDVANKIGTYAVALMAHAHNLPFYVISPSSTIDLSTPTGADIPIERRPDLEVTHMGGTRIVPEGVPVENPAFDVTPARYVTALVTEDHVVEHPDAEKMKVFAS